MKAEVRQMFENLTLEDFEELQQKAIKNERPHHSEQQQSQGCSASGQSHQVPTINTLNAEKQERVKIFKGKQRECDTHWIPGPNVVE